MIAIFLTIENFPTIPVFQIPIRFMDISIFFFFYKGLLPPTLCPIFIAFCPWVMA
jgi:hypothetical protein